MSVIMPAALRAMIDASRVKHIPSGQIILYEGDRPNEVLMIKRGVIKLYTIDEQGNEKILHLLTRAMLLPLAFFSGPTKAIKWYYTALTDVDVYVIPQASLYELMQRDGMVAVYLLHRFSNDVHELLVRLESLGKTNTQIKVMAVLQYLVACHAVEKRTGWWRVPFSVNHQLLADMIGVTRESTAISMKVLADKKIIRNPHLTVLEIQAKRLQHYKEQVLSSSTNQ